MEEGDNLKQGTKPNSAGGEDDRKSDGEEGQAVLSCQHHQVTGESGGVPVPLFLQVQARGTLPADREPR